MKTMWRMVTVAGLMGLLAWGPAVGSYGQGAQGELIKKKAKDLKKQIEGQQQGKPVTNAPSGKPKPPQPKTK